MRLSLSYTIWICIFSILPVAWCTTCYGSDGTNDNTEMLPCGNVDTICCALNRTNPAGGDLSEGVTKDECLPNGVCQSRYVENGNNVQTYWRDFCTNSNWDSGDCLNICTTGASVASFGNSQITPCDGKNTSSYWCCGNNISCCGTSSQIHINQIFGKADASSASSTATATATAAATTSTHTSSIATTTLIPTSAHSAENSGLSGGAKAGIGIGAAVGALALLGLGFFIARSLSWRKKARGDQYANRSVEQSDVTSQDTKYAHLGNGEEYQMMPPGYGAVPPQRTPTTRAELPAAARTAELPS